MSFQNPEALYLLQIESCQDVYLAITFDRVQYQVLVVRANYEKSIHETTRQLLLQNHRRRLIVSLYNIYRVTDLDEVF
jgi:hypothetical protein